MNRIYDTETRQTGFRFDITDRRLDPKVTDGFADGGETNEYVFGNVFGRSGLEAMHKVFHTGIADGFDYGDSGLPVSQANQLEVVNTTTNETRVYDKNGSEVNVPVVFLDEAEDYGRFQVPGSYTHIDCGDCKGHGP